MAIAIPADLTWLEDHLDHLTFATKGARQMEVTGVIRVDPAKEPGTAKEAVVHLTTKFLHLIDELDKRTVKRERLPEIVIGQVSGGYQAQVTLTVKLSSYVSPYTGTPKVASSLPKTITLGDSSMKWAA